MPYRLGITGYILPYDSICIRPVLDWAYLKNKHATSQVVGIESDSRTSWRCINYQQRFKFVLLVISDFVLV